MGIYEELGLQPIINATGAVTRLGGAPISAATLEAFCQAARECVPLEELQGIACRRIAAATGTEAGLVTSGAAAALTLGAAAMLAGHDLGRIERLPQSDGFPNEFVVAREHRNGYDHAVRAAGARLVEVGFHELAAGSGVRRVAAWEYETAFGPRTAGVLFVLTHWSHVSLADVVRRRTRTICRCWWTPPASCRPERISKRSPPPAPTWWLLAAARPSPGPRPRASSAAAAS